MVSKSGTMLRRLVPSGATNPASFRQYRDLEQVRRTLGHRDDALRDDRAAERRMRFRRRTQHGELFDRLLTVGNEWRHQRTRGVQFTRQQRDPRIF
jgi:hypothetical protein